MRSLLLCTLVLLATLSWACGRASFHTPPQFAKLEHKEPYTQRATSAEGVVIAVRKVSLAEPASLAFWTEAVAKRLQSSQGYALISSRDVKAKSGHAGKLLALGRDQNGRTFDYWVGIFPVARRLYLFEVGGRRDRFEQAKPEVEQALSSLSIR
jgi:hypothetical protein